MDPWLEKFDLFSKDMFEVTFRRPLENHRRYNSDEENDWRNKENGFVSHSINANNLPLPEDECKTLEYRCLIITQFLRASVSLEFLSNRKEKTNKQQGGKR